MADLVVQPLTRPLNGSVPVPADLATVERWATLASLAQGKSRIAWHGAETRLDVVLQRVGIDAVCGTSTEADRRERRYLEVQGRGLWGLSNAGNEPLYAGTTLVPHAILGILAAQRFASQVALPASTLRACTPLIDLLNARGARLEVASASPTADPQIAIGALNPSQRLDELERGLPLRAAALKSGLFFSGLFAHAPTTLHETWVSPDHTERLFAAVGLPVAALGTTVSLHPPREGNAIVPFSASASGDASLAAVLGAAAQMFLGSRVTLRNIGLNPTRLGVVDFLRQVGARVGCEAHGENLGEPYGQITYVSETLRGGSFDLELSARSGSELPLICAALGRAEGSSRVVEFAKIYPYAQEVVELLRSFGIIAEMHGDTLELEGRNAPLESARIASEGDAWRAMLATVLALGAKSESCVTNADCITEVFPRFVGTLRSLGAQIEVRA